MYEDLVSSNPPCYRSEGQRFPETSGHFNSLSFLTNPQKLLPDPTALSKAVSSILGHWADMLDGLGQEPLLHRLLISARPSGPNAEQASSHLEVLPLGHR